MLRVHGLNAASCHSFCLVDNELEHLDVAVGAFADVETARAAVQVESMRLVEVEDVADKLQRRIQQHNPPVVVVCYNDVVVGAQGQVARGMKLQVTRACHPAVVVPRIAIRTHYADPMKTSLDVMAQHILLVVTLDCMLRVLDVRMQVHLADLLSGLNIKLHQLGGVAADQQVPLRGDGQPFWWVRYVDELADVDAIL